MTVWVVYRACDWFAEAVCASEESANRWIDQSGEGFIYTVVETEVIE